MNAAGTPAPVTAWLCGRLDATLARHVERLARLPDVVRVAVMPDVHQGRAVPNGVAVATRHTVYPELVGADIGCGIAAVRFRGGLEPVRRDSLEAVLARLPAAVPTLKHTPQRAEQNRAAVEAIGPLSCRRLESLAAREGIYQLGTLGRGNHFLELARDEEGSAWAVVHTGSRALGQEITAHHLPARAGGREPRGPASADRLTGLDLESLAGRDYFSDMQWACRYAAANRAAILEAVAGLVADELGLVWEPLSLLDSPHNSATPAAHGGESVVVHRKSANDATAGRRGIVAGSMAVGSRIVQGLGHAEALASSAHGAGRLLSRTEAATRIGGRDLDARMRGIVYHQTWANRFRDEAPQAYRDLHEVMRAQRDLVRTERTLSPILNDKRP
ncbi:MAG: RtcB family protein [Planctomycetia bacterium]